MAVFFVELAILSVFALETNWRKYLLIGLFCGVAFSFRYGTITAASAIVGFVIFKNLIGREPIKPQLTWYSIFIFAFLVGASIQLLDNYFINSNPFHPTAARHLYHNGHSVVNLFSLENTLRGVRFFLTIHYKTLLLVAVLLCASYKENVSFLLWMLLLFTLAFYSSLHFYMHSDLQYILILFPCAYLSVASFFSRTDVKTLCIVAVSVILNFVLVSPESPYAYSPMCHIPIYAHYLLPFLTSVLLLSLSKYSLIEKKYGYTMAIYFALLSLGKWWVVLVVMLIFSFHYAKYIIRTYFSGVLRKRCVSNT